MNPEEMDQEAARIAQAVKQAREEAEQQAERIANAANAAVIERAAEAAKITQAVEDSRCRQFEQYKGTIGGYQKAVIALISVVMFLAGSFSTWIMVYPQIAINTEKLKTYPGQFEAIRVLLVANGAQLDKNTDELNLMKIAINNHIAATRNQ